MVMVGLWAMIIVSLSLIIHFGLFSKPPKSPLMHELSRFDLVLHCLAFASISIPAFILFQPMIRVGLGIFFLGVGLELVQWASMSREASVPDVAANALGIVIAAVIVWMLKRADLAILRPVQGRVS